MPTCTRPMTLDALHESGWRSRSIKQEIHDNFIAALARGDELFPGIIGFDDTVIPDLNNALIAMHDTLYLGEKGQAKSRLMRLIGRFLDEEIPYLDIPGCPVQCLVMITKVSQYELGYSGIEFTFNTFIERDSLLMILTLV